jgi:hypothetical protein
LVGLKIRAAQIDALAADHDARFVERVRASFIHGLGHEQRIALEARLPRMLAFAHSHGLSDHAVCEGLIGLCVRFGPRLEHAPQPDLVQEILTHPDLDAEAKLVELELLLQDAPPWDETT